MSNLAANLRDQFPPRDPARVEIYVEDAAGTPVLVEVVDPARWGRVQARVSRFLGSYDRPVWAKFF